MAYCKAKLKISGDKASPCFRSFWIENLQTHSEVNLTYEYLTEKRGRLYMVIVFKPFED
jgi:hypothetical protein